MRLMRRGWALVGWMLLLSARVPALYGQVATTTVRDTVYSASGAPAQGTVLVSWAAFTTANGSSVAAGTTSATLGSGGALSMQLVPNAGATPTGSYYTAVFHLSDGTTSRQYWVVPALPAGGTSVTLAAIQNQVLPTSMAMQTVSKGYVDTAIAKALTGAPADVTSSSYVLKAGDTMSGPLVLPGDPVSPQQAADKNYVDQSVAQSSSGGATKVSLVPTAAQTVAQPAGTQLEVNRLNGVLDAAGFLSGSGNNGIANALGSADCASGCEVQVGQNYLGTEPVTAGSVPSGSHVVDHRGGVDAEMFVNPLGTGSEFNFGSSLTQVTTRTAQQLVAARPGTAGPNSFVMNLQQMALTGGSNQFPVTLESVPYGKSNYGVLQLTGTYDTQGQHVQFGNVVNCYAVGDCLAGGQFITSSGGYRDEADEGTHPFDLQVAEDYRVFAGTCASGCTTGSTKLVVGSIANNGTQGDGRFLIDRSSSKVISTGSLVSGDTEVFQAASFAGTNFAVSVFLSTAQAATSQAANLAPGTVTMPIATSGVPSGYATSTAALPATTGVACVADPLATGSFPNFETATYTVVDGTHLKMALNKVHAAGATVAVGGLCGYGLEQTVDTVAGVRQVFPVVGSVSATKLFYAGALTGVVGYASAVNTSGYLNASLPITTAVRSGNVVTLTTGAALPYDLNGLPMTVNGVADASYNGTFTVTTTGNNTLTYVDNGADGSSSGGSVSVLTGGYNLYPMAEVLNVLNPSSAAVDGTLTLAPNTVAWATGDAVEEPHYHQQLVDADAEYITQYVPRPIQYSSAGKTYQGQVGPGTRGWQIANAVPASNYLGAGGTHQPPDDAFLATGVWRNSIETDAGQEAVLKVHCNLHTCGRWDSRYAVLALDAHGGQDFLYYDPNTDTASWNLAGATYAFSPSAFTAANVNATTVTAPTVTATTVTATSVGAATLTAGTLTSTSTAAHSVLLGGATTGAVGDSTAVIAGAGHGLELLSTSGTPHSTFVMSATLNGTPTPLFEIGAGYNSVGKNFYVYDGSQNYVPLFSSEVGKFVGINNTAPQHTLDVAGDVAAQSVVLSDTANGHTYRLTITNGTLTTTQIQ